MFLFIFHICNNEVGFVVDVELVF